MSRRGSRGAQAVSWQDVDAFLEMAAQALRARTQAAEELAAKLSATNQRLEKEIREKGQVSRACFQGLQRFLTHVLLLRSCCALLHSLQLC